MNNITFIHRDSRRKISFTFLKYICKIIVTCAISFSFNAYASVSADKFICEK